MQNIYVDDKAKLRLIKVIEIQQGKRGLIA